MPDHVPTFSRYRRGTSPVTGRESYGYHVTCSCGGYEQRVNGNKRVAKSLWRSHVAPGRAAPAQCGICGGFIKRGNTGKCQRCGTEWDNGRG